MIVILHTGPSVSDKDTRINQNFRELYLVAMASHFFIFTTLIYVHVLRWWEKTDFEMKISTKNLVVQILKSQNLNGPKHSKNSSILKTKEAVTTSHSKICDADLRNESQRIVPLASGRYKPWS